MAIKKFLGKIIIAAVFLFPCHALCAQQAGYYVDYTESKPRFIQRFVWDREEYALYYEVLIYIDDNGFREYLKDITEENLILVSLPPGKYRYSVTPFDLLGLRGESSQWKEFEVLPAYQPSLDSFAPEAFYLDRNLARELQISGDNFLEESEIYLQNGTDLIYPEKVIIVSSKRATLIFDDMKLIPGNYEIYVNNPGGLSANSGVFVIGYRKPLDFFLKVLWNPYIPVYGYMNDLMGPNVHITGASFNFEAISSKRGNFNGGLELVASVYYLNPAISLKISNENYPFAGAGFLLTSFDLNIALQRRFNLGQMAVTFRFGFGIATAGGGFGDYEQNDLIMQLNLGATYLVRLYKDLYLEAGLDFNHHVSPIPSGIIKPRLGVVWQF
jgi:hypothetical protein